jgi:hypothetical protein
MHDAAIVPSVAPGWLWSDDAAAAVDPRWPQPSFRDATWRVAQSPFRWGIDMHQAIREGVRRLYFRYAFQLAVGRATAESKFRLTVATQGAALEVYLNSQRLELTQDAPQKKRGEFAATISGRDFRRGDNLLAASAEPPGDFDATVLDLRIDELAPESEEVEEKLVTEQAVVCDQCSSLPGNRHACVYACPHEAAFRVDAWVDFPQA